MMQGDRLVVLDNGETKIALVTCASCMIPREIYDAAKKQASQAIDGRPIAVWANYSLHYVGGVPANSLSADL